MTPREVDVVVAVHDPRRPVARAVASVLAQDGVHARVTVVCHNTDPAVIVEALGAVHAAGGDDRVRTLELRDGVPSPAGPFNLGLDRAEAPFVSIMGSDDWLERGALASWLEVARGTGAEVVIPRLAHANGARVPTPAARPGRVRDLDLVEDRLSYRSAPLGLVRRETVDRLGLRMREGLRVGEDVAFATALWAGAKVAFDRRGPAYVIGDDAVERVTYTPRPIAEELAFVLDLVALPWFTALPPAARRAIAVKVVRIHVFGAVFHRQKRELWTSEERRDLSAVVHALDAAAPHYDRVLSLADRKLLDLTRSRTGTADALIAASVRRRHHGRPATVLTRDLSRLLAREAPVRFMAASFLTTR
ncbi:glycosyltransferase [Cellulosimicrobium sp. BIT-GX5]|uniref:Glycosyltransferase n=1 Tax=Cellulosimicrobium composti TaxID=2672572 RepID=A0A6N7ZG75_9MICO|nr:glycosyltransferase [Cellulosimicrobium composti]